MRRRSAFTAATIAAAALVISVFSPGAADAAPATSFQSFTPRSDTAKILLLEPKIDIVFLTTTGPEKRVEWNQAARANMVKALTAELTATRDVVIPAPSTATLPDDVQQVLLLQQAVAESMSGFQFRLPHQRKQKERYTIGANAERLAGDTGAEYAMLIDARAQIESSGVQITRFVLSYAGVGMASHGFRGTAVSVIDLKTGDLVWLKMVTMGDARTEAEATGIARRLFSPSPFGDVAPPQ